MSDNNTIIIGAGASGCFCAIELKRRHPDMDICVLEAAPKPMSKLALTGGGRCNLTNSFEYVQSLKEVYPRGEQLMRRALRVFDQNDCMAWWEREGVSLVVQEDACVFPRSQDAMQLVRTLERLMRSLGIALRLNCRANAIRPEEWGYTVETSAGSLRAKRVVLCIGGCSSSSLGRMLPEGVPLTPTVPSLFTLKIDSQPLRELAGTVVADAGLLYSGCETDTKRSTARSRGILLLTDWGVSGPATLRLSSYAARMLALNQYRGSLTINWLSLSEEEARKLVGELLNSSKGQRQHKLLCNCRPEGLSERLWKHIIARAGLRDDIRCDEMGSKGLSRLATTLCADCYAINGRAKFKEEFVCCGGVDLKGVNINTLESKQCPGLFFTGEVLDIDAVTGGFNLQAAWSTAMVVAGNI